MALASTLLMLTLMADGSVRMTLSDAESAPACEAARASVVRILSGSGKPPVLTMCGQTDLRLTPFVHGTPASAEVLRYRVELPASGGFDIKPLQADETCTQAPKANPAVYCTRSAQKPVPRS